jgi:hypothetical protein
MLASWVKPYSNKLLETLFSAKSWWVTGGLIDKYAAYWIGQVRIQWQLLRDGLSTADEFALQLTRIHEFAGPEIDDIVEELLANQRWLNVNPFPDPYKPGAQIVWQLPDESVLGKVNPYQYAKSHPYWITQWGPLP